MLVVIYKNNFGFVDLYVHLITNARKSYTLHFDKLYRLDLFEHTISYWL